MGLPTWVCVRCGKRARTQEFITSRHSRSHYCANITACAKRAKRKK